MHVDHFFTIGQQHVRNGTPCEDYALSGRLEDGTVYAALSDGCSGANARTDLGARGWCLAFERRVREHGAGAFEHDFLPDLLASYQARRWTDSLRDDLASLIALVATPERAELWLMGDGGYALHHTNGDLSLVGFTWINNTPFYPTYLLHDRLYTDFAAAFQGGVVEPVTERRQRWSFTDGSVTLVQDDTLTHPFEAFDGGHRVTLDPRNDGVLGVSLFTDGLWSIGAAPSGGLPVLDAVREALAFKTLEGTFVKRRMGRALQRWARDGHWPQDDLGTATVRWPLSPNAPAGSDPTA